MQQQQPPTQVPLLPPAPPFRPSGVPLTAPPRRHRAPSASHSRAPAPVEGTFCNYSHRVCMQNRLEGYEFCIKHILEDKTSPFRQCNYVSQTGKRCPNATPKADKKNDGYCQEHASRVAMVKQRALRKRKPKETPETLLADLDHYTSQEQKRPLSLAARALEYAVSSSDSEGEPALVDQAWRGDGDSDAESVDSEQEDPLKHAGVYTSEEVALITRDKLIRLQSLYIDQFKRLQHLLKEKRRRYLHTVRAERERLGSIHYAKEDPEQREYYDMLQSMKRYHRRFGTEALLHRQSKERRIQVSEGLHYRPPAYPKCVHTTPPTAPNSTATKCSERAVPLSKYCKMHIACDDVHQVLYKTCGYGGGACTVPVPALAPDRRCYLHAQLAAHIPHRLPAKNSRHSSSEEEDEEKDLSVDVTTVEGTKLEQTENKPIAAPSSTATSTTSQPSSTPVGASISAPRTAPTSAPNPTPTHAPATTTTHVPTTAPASAPKPPPMRAPATTPTSAPNPTPMRAPTTAPVSAPNTVSMDTSLAPDKAPSRTPPATSTQENAPAKDSCTPSSAPCTPIAPPRTAASGDSASSAATQDSTKKQDSEPAAQGIGSQ